MRFNTDRLNQENMENHLSWKYHTIITLPTLVIADTGTYIEDAFGTTMATLWKLQRGKLTIYSMWEKSRGQR